MIIATARMTNWVFSLFDKRIARFRVSFCVLLNRILLLVSFTVGQDHCLRPAQGKSLARK